MVRRGAEESRGAGTDGRSESNVSSANTMPYIVDAVRAYATVGEICEALRTVYGTYPPQSALRNARRGTPAGPAGSGDVGSKNKKEKH